MKINLKFIFAIVVNLSFLIINKAYAICPVCTIAAASFVGLSRYFGVDDAITGIWIGGFLLSSSLWFNNALKKKHVRFPFKKYVIIISFYLVVILPLYWFHLIGIPGNTLWNIDKLLLGIFVGSIVFIFGVFIDLVLRTLNDCKVYFYFQRIMIPISLLLIATVIFYFITK